MWMNMLIVAIGGAIGSTGRYLLGPLTAKWWAHLQWPFNEWPLGTFIANVSGGLIMGIVMGMVLGPWKGGPDTERLRLFLATGILGGYTTFSSFSLEVFQMLERRAYALAGLYAGLSFVLSVTAVAIGFLIIRKLVPA